MLLPSDPLDSRNIMLEGQHHLYIYHLKASTTSQFLEHKFGVGHFYTVNVKDLNI